MSEYFDDEYEIFDEDENISEDFIKYDNNEEFSNLTESFKAWYQGYDETEHPGYMMFGNAETGTWSKE